MHPCELLKENGRAHFMTKRFDRDAGGVRHHMQSLCALAGMDYNLVAVHSYHQLFDTMVTMKLPRAALVEGLRRLVFNVLAANNDDHPKNFSFLWKQGGTGWELSPAYDVTLAYDPASKWVSKHMMSVNGKFDAITKSDMRAVAERYSLLADFNAVYEQVEVAVSRWREFADAAEVSSDEQARVKLILDRLSASSSA